MDKLKGIIFDFNGVIVDDYPLQKEAWSEISRQIRGRDVSDREMLDDIRGKPREDIISWLGKDKLKTDKISEYSTRKQVLIQELYRQSPYFCLNKGLENLLAVIKKSNIPIAIATSSGYDSIVFSFEKLNLGRWFDFENVVYFDGTYPGKPAPDSYLRAAKKLNLNPRDILVFEDALSGITSAYRAGIRNIIAVGTDDRLEFLAKQNGVVKVIHDFTEFNLNDYF